MEDKVRNKHLCKKQSLSHPEKSLQLGLLRTLHKIFLLTKTINN
jgi:hypothetical protein